jgi:hypothetical protein
MSPLYILLLGALGALAPEIVRLYTIRRSPEKFEWSSFYLIVSLLYAGLGGVLAIFLPATTAWGAIYVGASTPVLINSMIRTARNATKEELRGPGRRDMRYQKVDSYLNGL